ncbi:MAG: SPASM domain-containing protein [Deltaproteobacteria bacterium]|nr:SPASM domain-containing protein [Deltaproteobacteria bacterium]
MMRIRTKRKWNTLLSKLNATMGLVRLSHMPMYMMIEPTNYCNLACPLCPTGNGEIDVPRGYMEYGKFERLISTMASSLDTLLIWGFGEPLLHPEIFKMVSFASSVDIKTKISTNGQCFGGKDKCNALVDSGLTQLRVSLDGLSDKVLQVYRKGASFELIMEGLSNIIDRKKATHRLTPQIILQFIAMEHNKHEIPKLTKLAEKMNIGWRIKTVSIGNKNAENKEQKIFPDPEKSRYKPMSLCETSEKKPRVCPYPWFWLHVNWDGTIVPCCKDPHRRHLIGNVFEQNIHDIWNNEAFMAFRKNYLKDPAKNKRCKKCDLFLGSIKP